jgi:soluble lytic murein transglycosylase
LAATGSYTSAIDAYQTAKLTPRLDDLISLDTKIGNSYYILGDYQTALVVYSDVYTRTNSDYVKASMDYMSGLAYIQLGQNEAAYAAYLDAVEKYPLSYDTYLGLINLVNAGYPVDEFDRGIVDYFAGQYSLAIAAFDRYLLNPGEFAGTAHYYKGLAYRTIDSPIEAIKAWDMVIRNFRDDELWPDAWEQKGYTQWAYLDQYEQAQSTFLDFVENNSFHPRAHEFLFYAGQVAERAGDLEQATENWMRIPSEYPQSDLLPRAVFLSGISQYRRGEFTTALEIFLEGLNYPGNRSALYFWIGKSHLAMGERGLAENSWREAVGIDPTGYYSERARDLLLDREAFTPPLMYDLGFDFEGERGEAEIWMQETFAIPSDLDISVPGYLQNDPRWIRGTELWRLGLYENARAEFEDLRNESLASPVDSYRLANYLADIGLYRSAIFAARQVLNLNHMDDADTMNAPHLF